MTAFRLLFVGWVGLSLTGCIDSTDALLPTVPVRANLVSPANGQKIPRELQPNWWRLANDPILSQNIETALSENLNLKDIALRLEAVQAARAVASGAYRPQIGVNAHLRRETTAPREADTSAAGKYGKLATFAEGGANASWELDLFGRGGGQTRLAEADISDAQIKLDAARAIVALDVFSAYARARLEQEELGILARALEARRKLLGVVRSRAKSGLASDFDIARVETELQRLESRLPVVEGHLQETEAILAALNGQPNPQPLQASKARVHLSAFQFSSIPADLLRRRPDVRFAANAILRAAGERDIAQADLYPRLYLKGDFALAPSFTSGIPTNIASALGPVLTIPLFDRDLRHAQLSASEKILEASSFAYRDRIVTASTEVFQSLSRLRVARRQRARLTEAVASSHLALRKAEELFKGGLIGLSDQLIATLVATELETDAIEAKRSEIYGIVALMRSVGPI